MTSLSSSDVCDKFLTSEAVASLLSLLAKDTHLGSFGAHLHLEMVLRRIWWPVAAAIDDRFGSLDWPRIVGIAGPPGAGKTSLANALAIIFRRRYNLTAARLSLEDAYYDPITRHHLGLAWRAVPGSHDLLRLRGCLRDIRAGICAPHLPRYDMVADRCLPDEVLEAPLNLLFLEGWLVGSRLTDYAELSDAVDLLIYIDLPYDTARDSRIARENKARALVGTGLDAVAMEAFWQSVLGPGIQRWVRPIRRRADIILELDHRHEVINLIVNEFKLPY